jgi:hypothetical protein
LRAFFSHLHEALDFCCHYRELYEKRPTRFAAILFPEFLSALEQAREERKRGVIWGQLTHVSDVMSSLALSLAGDKQARQLATARMNNRDRQFLRIMSHEQGGAVETRLAAYALRAVLEEDPSWRTEMLEWWKDGGERSWQFNDSGLATLACVSVVTERAQPGTALELLGRLSLKQFDPKAFECLAYGLLGDVSTATKAAVTLAESNNIFDIARGFFLSQLLREHLSDDQRDRVLTIARRSLDEPGVLSLEAARTIGVLSQSPADVYLLLESQPAVGVDHEAHKVTMASAVEDIVRGSQTTELRQLPQTRPPEASVSHASEEPIVEFGPLLNPSLSNHISHSCLGASS